MSGVLLSIKRVTCASAGLALRSLAYPAGIRTTVLGICTDQGDDRESFTANAIRNRKRFGAMMETDVEKIARGELLYYREAKAATTFGVYRQEGADKKCLLRIFTDQLDAVLFMEELADKQHVTDRECTFAVERMSGDRHTC